MKKGFSHGVAPALIRETPGMRADQVAERALSSGLCDSDAKDPIRSLAATLAKEVREGRLPEVCSREVAGVLRYYPTSLIGIESFELPIEVGSGPDEAVSIRLPHTTVNLADQMVEVGKFGSRSEALAWLVSEGIKRNGSEIENVRESADRIRTIKSAFQSGSTGAT